MPFILIRNDIARVRADAVVNPANEGLLEGSGASRAIFLAAGEKELKAACSSIGHCPPGEAVCTDAFGLDARYIIHAVCPVWRGGRHGEEECLVNTYASALGLAYKKNCSSIAFPLLSSGNCGFPKDRAMKAALSAVSDFLDTHDMTIYMVLYDRKSLSVSKRLFTAVDQYIDDHYIDERKKAYEFDDGGRRQRYIDSKGAPGRVFEAPLPAPAVKSDAYGEPYISRKEMDIKAGQKVGAAGRRRLDELLERLDETFSERLLRLIDERGLKDSYVYKRANIDRRHFSKIRSNADYKPTKKTVFAFAVALCLSLDETKDLLISAGYSISPSSRFDVIMSFFIENGIYDIFEINELLFSYGEDVIGG